MRDDLVRDKVKILLDFGIAELAADQALDRGKGVLWVGDGAATRRGADQHFTVLERHDGWRGAVAFRILDDARRSTIHDRHAGIGGTEVNTDDLAHLILSPKSFIRPCWPLAQKLGLARRNSSATATQAPSPTHGPIRLARH